VPAATGTDEEVIVDRAGAIGRGGASLAQEAVARLGQASVVGAIDVGSNSAHGLIAVVRDHDIEPVVDRSAFLGLGWAVDRRGTVGRDKETELVEALGRYARRARGLEAGSITVVGTEPLRRAADAARVVRAVEQRCGVPFHVLGHDEEGLLTLIGVTLGRPVERTTAIVDIGGGSTEVVLASPAGPPVAVGVRLGSARLTARYIAHDPVRPDEIRAMTEEARRAMAAVSAGRPDELVGVGGTASNILRVMDGRGDTDLTRERLEAAIGVLATQASDAVAERYGVKPLRARLLPAGAAILTAALDHFGLEALRISDAGIREGLALASARAGAGWRDRLTDLAAGWA
jgi:exopolyphosphatase/guanosine-5'-triphosphate,3'-diphosphate pyrophosphatase